MFDYDEAFSRNLGWVTADEQAILRSKRVAIAGLGGVGGSHLLTLTRLGIGKFNISDLDNFELANFNRQAGAFVSRLGQPKIAVLAELATDINPQLQINRFENGIDRENIETFLTGVDLYVDALDFFAFDARRCIFEACAERGIPAITAAPLGMGAALLCFLPGGMTFEEYFRLEGQSEQEQALRLLLGLSPAMLQMRYLVDDSRVDFNTGKGPSTPMACEMCAGVAVTQALKILLNRGKVPAAPRGVHYDAYRNKVSHTWRPGGNDNPIQRLGLHIARKRVMGKQGERAPDPEATLPDTAVYRVLELAKWAPSGDNEQPWRFEVTGDDRFLVHGHDTRDWCLYDLDGHSSQLALGALQETIAIAAGGEGLEAQFQVLGNEGDPDWRHPRLAVTLAPASKPYREELLPFIRSRVTQRRPMKRTSLPRSHKTALAEVLGPGYRVVWFEGRQRLELARLLFRSAYIRLTTREGYEVHRQTIEWGARYSEDRIPEKAVGVDWLTLRIMHWALNSWQRIEFLNRFLAGSWLPRIQMDFLTGLACAAHFVIVADRAPGSPFEYLDAGRAVQRFWLQATRLGLQFQPEMTPLIFTRYHLQGRRFAESDAARERAASVAADLCRLAGLSGEGNDGVYMGRVGFGPAPVSRSIRPPLERLMHVEASRR